jgi:hypothetical protein
VRQKRLFWISIIIVEVVLLYIVWRPYRDRFMRPPHRIAQTPPVVRRPETKPTAVVVEPRKPWKATHSHLPAPDRSLIVNASLKVPEPVPAPPPSVLVPQITSGPPGSFWCYMAMIGSDCACKVSRDERASNLLQ